MSDAVFRGGSKPSNDGDAALKMVTHVVRFIRQHHGEEVPIILRLDAGFFDQEWCAGFEKLQIGYICRGRHGGAAVCRPGGQKQRTAPVCLGLRGLWMQTKRAFSFGVRGSWQKPRVKYALIIG